MPIHARDLNDVFTYHAPEGRQPEQYARLREAAKAFAAVILEETPTCGDQQAALRHVREALMTANASVALGGRV
jgi:hypothetical protein